MGRWVSSWSRHLLEFSEMWGREWGRTKFVILEIDFSLFHCVLDMGSHAFLK